MQNVYTDSGVYGIDIYPEESYGLYGYLYIGLRIIYLLWNKRHFTHIMFANYIRKDADDGKNTKTKRRIKLEKRRIDLFMYIIPFQKVL